MAIHIKSEFLRGVLTVSAAAAIAQAITFAASPLIARLYSPEIFGAFAQCMAIVSIVGTIVTLRYDDAIPLPASMSQTLDIVALCLVLCTAFFMAMLPIAFLIVPQLASTYISAAYLNAPFIALLAACVFSSGLIAVNMSWYIRYKSFDRLARMRLGIVCGNLSVQLVLGFLHSDVESMIIAFLFGNLVGVWCSIDTLAVFVRGTLRRMSRHRRLRRAAGRYRVFPLYSIPSSLLNVMSQELPSLVLPVLYDPVTGGLYMLARRVLGVPADVMAQSVSRVFWGHAAWLMKTNPRALFRLFIRTNTMVLLCVVPALSLFLVGPDLLGFVFGQEWRGAGTFAALMSIAYVAHIAAVATNALHVYSLNRWQTAWDLSRLFGIVTCLWVAWQLRWTPETCIGVMMVTNAANSLVLVYLNWVGIRRLERGFRCEPVPQGEPGPIGGTT